MKRLLLAELLLVLITIIFVSLNPISRIYIADYLEKISLFLFRTVSDEDLNKWYETRDKNELLEELGGAAYWLTFNLNVYNPLLKINVLFVKILTQ